MNSFHNNIKFTFESSSEQVSFFDVSIRLDGIRLKTSLYSKPADAHSYLPPPLPIHTTFSKVSHTANAFAKGGFVLKTRTLKNIFKIAKIIFPNGVTIPNLWMNPLKTPSQWIGVLFLSIKKKKREQTGTPCPHL